MDMGALSDAELESELLTWAGRVAAGQAVVLRLLGEVEARGSWQRHGLRSCAHWVAWRMSVSLTTAQEKVRVARSLRALPAVAAAFEQGRVSYAQVRALTRVATPADEGTWLELARHSTAAQLEVAVRGAARVRREEQRQLDPDTVAEQDRVRSRWDEDGTLVLTLRIPPGQAPLVLAALEARTAQVGAEQEARLADLATELIESEEPSAEGSEAAGAESVNDDVNDYVYVEPPLPDLPSLRGQPKAPDEDALMADWWVEHRSRRDRADAARQAREQRQAEAVAREIPTGRVTLVDGLVRALLDPTVGTPVTVQLLTDPVSGWARTAADELFPPSSVKTLLRTALTARDGAGLTRYDRGRRSREVSPQLRTLLGQVDGERCRFPGCTHTRWLHAHHVRFWSRCGRTDVANLVLACSHHHQLIHEEGYQLRLDDHRVLHVRDKDGRPVLHRPALVPARAEDLDPERAVTPDSLPASWTGEPMDLGYVTSVLLAHAA